MLYIELDEIKLLDHSSSSHSLKGVEVGPLVLSAHIRNFKGYLFKTTLTEKLHFVVNNTFKMTIMRRVSDKTN